MVSQRIHWYAGYVFRRASADILPGPLNAEVSGVYGNIKRVPLLTGWHF